MAFCGRAISGVAVEKQKSSLAYRPFREAATFQNRHIENKPYFEKCRTLRSTARAMPVRRLMESHLCWGKALGRHSLFHDACGFSTVNRRETTFLRHLLNTWEGSGSGTSAESHTIHTTFTQALESTVERVSKWFDSMVDRDTIADPE